MASFSASSPSAYSVWTYEQVVQAAPESFRKTTVHCSSVSVSLSCLNHDDIIERVQSSELHIRAFDLAAVSFVAPAEHTMAYALPQYVLGKVPAAYIHEAAQFDYKFCVWGIFDAHIIPYAWSRGYQAVHIPNATKRAKSTRKQSAYLNAERPRLFLLTPLDSGNKQNRPFYVLSVIPGSDYVYHYARMVILRLVIVIDVFIILKSTNTYT